MPTTAECFDLYKHEFPTHETLPVGALSDEFYLACLDQVPTNVPLRLSDMLDALCCFPS